MKFWSNWLEKILIPLPEVFLSKNLQTAEVSPC